MKHDDLRSIVHNVADSLASGLSLLVGYHSADVFGEASRSDGGSLTIDFLHGRVVDGKASASLANAIPHYQSALAQLCSKAGGSITDLSEANVRFRSDHLDCRFAVTIEDAAGRRSTTEYAGTPGRRVKVMDELGRLRPKPSIG